MRYRLTVAALSPIALLAAGAFAGCAQGTTSPNPSGVDGGEVMDAASPGDAASSGDAGLCGVDCSTIDAPPCMMSVCNEGALPGAVGDCVMVALSDGAVCDDGDFCTVGDTCTAGVCAGAPNDCADVVAGECQETVCDSAAGACVVRAASAMDGMSCTSSDLCLTETTCSSGECVGTPRDCSALPAPNECQAAACNPSTGACELMNANEGGSCAATDACIVGSVCAAGVCTGGASPPCSATSDGCCPSTCTMANDADCCPGEVIAGTCVYLPSTVSAASQTAARASCAALGTGWDLCDAATLCTPSVVTYLANSGCGCGGGAATCACGSSDNIYVHVDGTSPYYVRGPDFPSCISSAACTDSVSETCGVPLCCRAVP